MEAHAYDNGSVEDDEDRFIDISCVVCHCSENNPIHAD